MSIGTTPISPLLTDGQEGTSEQDQANGIAMAQDGSVVVVGATKGDWNGANASFDFAAFRLDADDGDEEVWRYQVGLPIRDGLVNPLVFVSMSR